jgi:hypothetical protein
MAIRTRTALPASAGDRKQSIWACVVMVALVCGLAESAPCLLIAAGFCERAGRVTGARSGAAGALDAAAREQIMPGRRDRESLMADMVQRSGGGLPVRGDQPWRPGAGRRQPALPRSAGLGCCPGDMMIGGTSPPDTMQDQFAISAFPRKHPREANCQRPYAQNWLICVGSVKQAEPTPGRADSAFRASCASCVSSHFVIGGRPGPDPGGRRRRCRVGAAYRIWGAGGPGPESRCGICGQGVTCGLATGEKRSPCAPEIAW